MPRPLVHKKLFLVLAIACLARLGALFAFPSVFAFSQPGSDIHGSVAYDAYALNLLETGVYGRQPGAPDSVLPPLYSIALALVYAVFGRSYVAVGLVHTLFDVCSIALLYDIARRLFPRHRGEWIGALGALVIGFRRAVFSNEAGLGSAAIAHAVSAASHTSSTFLSSHPGSNGFIVSPVRSEGSPASNRPSARTLCSIDALQGWRTRSVRSGSTSMLSMIS